MTTHEIVLPPEKIPEANQAMPVLELRDRRLRRPSTFSTAHAA